MAVSELRFEDYLSRVPAENRHKLHDKIESDADLAKIAQNYTDWEETCPYLGLTPTDEEDILNNRTVGIQRYIHDNKTFLKWYILSVYQ